MVAEPGNIDACKHAGLEHRHPLRDFDRVAIDEDLDCVIRVGEMDAGAGHRVPLGEIWLGLGLGGSCFSRVVELRRGDDGAAELVAGVGGGEAGGSENGPRSEVTQPHLSSAR